MIADYTLDDIEDAHRLSRSPEATADGWLNKLQIEWHLSCDKRIARRVYKQRSIIGTDTDLLATAISRNFYELVSVLLTDESSPYCVTHN